MNDIATDKIDAVRERILDAAWQRLGHYGLNKTTMAEIADDCQMSAANLYRYFKNKHEIATACCSRAMSESAKELRKIVRQPDISAEEKLKRYAVRMVELNSERACGDKIGELVANMTENNTDIIHAKIADHHSRIAEILAQGNANGEFSLEDVLKSAELVYTSLVVFDVPLFVDLFPLEKYKKTASGVVDLIVYGLKNR